MRQLAASAFAIALLISEVQGLRPEEIVSEETGQRQQLKLRLRVEETISTEHQPRHVLKVEFRNNSSKPIWISLASFHRRLGVRVVSSAGEEITRFAKGLGYLPAGEGPLPPPSLKDFQQIRPNGSVIRKVELEKHLSLAGRLGLMKPGAYAIAVNWHPHSFGPDSKDIARLTPWKETLVSNLVQISVKASE